MIKSSKLRKVLFSTWSMAVIPAIVIILFLPSIGSKYKLLVEPVDKFHAQYFYTDLNSDTVTEAVRSGKGLPYFHVLVQDNNLKVYDQWNFKDSMDINLSDFFFGNYDYDKYKEIYTFTYKEDSIFLNINEFFESDGKKLDRIYITRGSVVNKQITSTVFPAGFFDLNGDGKGELYFSIATGFGVVPRLLYSYDIVNDELKESQFLGNVIQWPTMIDTDDDKKPEIFGFIGAAGNNKTEVPFTDRSTWLMVFNENLRFEFPPVEFPGLTNKLKTGFYRSGNFRGYILIHNTGSADTSVFKPRIMIYSLEGLKIRERLLSDLGLNTDTEMVLMNDGNTNRIFLTGEWLMEINDELKILKKVKGPFNSYFGTYSEDLDFNGEKELLLYCSNTERLVVYNSSLQKLDEVKIKKTDLIFKFSTRISKEKEKELFMSTGEDGYFLNLKRNNYFFLGYSVYPGIYLLVFFFILLIMKINTNQVMEREKLKQRLVTLQLRGIKAQLDPHFTFNTLNSVASLIYLEDRQAAYDYMNKFTQLLRGMLNDAERVYRSIREELDFVITYLDLEKLRFGDKLKYKIVIGEGISQKEQVPKLVLHTFAENAVKHGIMPRIEGGNLLIRIDKQGNYIKLSIEDDGIGRAKSAGQSTSTGKGLKITREFYDILNQINKNPIKLQITDLFDNEGNPAGTSVEVLVPVQ